MDHQQSKIYKQKPTITVWWTVFTWEQMFPEQLSHPSQELWFPSLHFTNIKILRPQTWNSASRNGSNYRNEPYILKNRAANFCYETFYHDVKHSRWSLVEINCLRSLE